MINVIIEDENKINKKQKKSRTDIFLLTLAVYVLYRISVNHEKEITNLKKVIKEMKSKGE